MTRDDIKSITKLRNNGNHQFGEERHTSKLTREEVVEIKAALEEGESQYEVAERYDVSRSCIGKIDRGETWTHV